MRHVQQTQTLVHAASTTLDVCVRRRVSLACVPDQARPTASGRAHEGFRAQMRALLAEVKGRGDPAPGDQSIAALLLRLRDPKTGAHAKSSPVAAVPDRCDAEVRHWYCEVH